MLFLGAGASKPLGVATMREFNDVVLKELEALGGSTKEVRDYVPRILEIRSEVQNFGFEPDIEAILTVLQGRAQPLKALEVLRHRS